MDKKKSVVQCHVLYSFWTMIALFFLMMIFSGFKLQLLSLIAGALFIISVFYVFVSSIMAVFPENSMAYVALFIASMFVLYLILSAMLGSIGASSVLG